MNLQLERILLANVRIPFKLARRLGLCRHGHPGYVRGGYGWGNRDFTGANVGIRTGKRNPSAYCLACHRAQEAENATVIFPKTVHWVFDAGAVA